MGFFIPKTSSLGSQYKLCHGLCYQQGMSAPCCDSATAMAGRITYAGSNLGPVVVKDLPLSLPTHLRGSASSGWIWLKVVFEAQGLVQFGSKFEGRESEARSWASTVFDGAGQRGRTKRESRAQATLLRQVETLSPISKAVLHRTVAAAIRRACRNFVAPALSLTQCEAQMKQRPRGHRQLGLPAMSW